MQTRAWRTLLQLFRLLPCRPVVDCLRVTCTSPSVGVSSWEGPEQVLHLHLHTSTLELHSGVVNAPSVSGDMFSHLSMKQRLRGNAVGFRAGSATKFRIREREKMVEEEQELSRSRGVLIGTSAVFRSVPISLVRVFVRTVPETSRRHRHSSPRTPPLRPFNPAPR